MREIRKGEELYIDYGKLYDLDDKEDRMEEENREGSGEEY